MNLRKIKSLDKKAKKEADEATAAYNAALKAGGTATTKK